jgi:hypothetical protein
MIEQEMEAEIACQSRNRSLQRTLDWHAALPLTTSYGRLGRALGSVPEGSGDYAERVSRAIGSGPGHVGEVGAGRTGTNRIIRGAGVALPRHR